MLGRLAKSGEKTSSPSAVHLAAHFSQLRCRPFGLGTRSCYVILATPSDAEQFHELVRMVYPKATSDVASPNVLTMLGYLADSCVRKKPLLIVASGNGDKEHTAKFIPFSSIVGLRDEADVGEPCTFAIDHSDLASGDPQNRRTIFLKAQLSSTYIRWVETMKGFIAGGEIEISQPRGGEESVNAEDGLRRRAGQSSRPASLQEKSTGDTPEPLVADANSENGDFARMRVTTHPSDKKSHSRPLLASYISPQAPSAEAKPASPQKRGQKLEERTQYRRPLPLPTTFSSSSPHLPQIPRMSGFLPYAAQDGRSTDPLAAPVTSPRSGGSVARVWSMKDRRWKEPE
ncbi:uncharacterized protein EV422DRAFT_512094 [Fimicolochytrium jonesii]|uniref:uncharacterized protein n=1 Tax=Fimicolochytrium jonesii TaxID=1396493 RepID=UPI0022FE67B5|nr:uncharacterized protein EV422DRAFT_512094 [Fimicolochytrium jonesii]KAI8826962.1 hypothetical protein EV422DRAFT_512094 [Fimicolochytrium jonesii]